MAVVRWTVRFVAALTVIALVAIGAIYLMSHRIFTHQYDAAAAAPAIDLRHGDIERGQHFALAVTGCTECHGADLSGRLFISDPALGTVYTPNLTRGQGGIGATYSDEDWVRALRYGLRRDGTPLLIMPSQDFAVLSNADFAAIVSYILSVPPVSNATPPIHVGPIGRMLYATRQLPISADVIQREHPQPSTVQPGVTVAYGEYLARAAGCMTCHGARLSGGHLEGAPSDPPAQNLTPAGDLKNWSFAQFEQTLRTGVRPNGTQINKFMPWPNIGQMTDDELLAIYQFLKSVPPRATGNG